MTIDRIKHYFPNITDEQFAKIAELNDLYRYWNERINVISRKDIDALYEKHVLHSLAIAKVVEFEKGQKILDVGTGGGFPGIPLAIFFPDAHFHLIDSIAKKIKVVNEVAKSLNLKNITAQQIKSTMLKGNYDTIVSRAVTNFPDFVKSTKHLLHKFPIAPSTSGIIYLKGGDFDEEIRPFRKNIKVYEISEFFTEEFFETKKIIHLKFN